MLRHAALRALALVIVFSAPLVADTPVTREEIEAFMRSAKVIRVRDIGKGVTRPLRLTLSNGSVTHDASFKTIDEKRNLFQPQQGRPEVNFVDSWRYDVAGYRVAVLLGLERMTPVTIEYWHQGKVGALSWWLESIMDEAERRKKKMTPADPTVWNQDMYRLRVFTELVHDTDRHLGNVLVSPEWRVLMVDFSRAFRLWAEIRTKDLHRCDRRLLERLESLTMEEARAAVDKYLTRSELEAVMQRRDLIVKHFRGLIATLGEEKVLY